MAYLSSDCIRWAIRELGKGVHPFLGITFLTCKKARLPVGGTKSISLDGKTKSHLEKHHRLDPRSGFYFQPFKSRQFWVTRKYPSAGLQTINTRSFDQTFMHPRNTKRWGFTSDYVDATRRKINELGYRAMSLLAIALWIGKEKAWATGATLDSIVNNFTEDYCITKDEQAKLFSLLREFDFPEQKLLVDEPPNLQAIAHEFSLPPDAPSLTEGTLASLRLRNVGPAESFDLEFGERLTLIAGDNGLGKSFLLDAAWWAITGKWAKRQALPDHEKNRTAEIRFAIRDSKGGLSGSYSTFDRNRHSWIDRRKRPSVSALCVYADVDGSIAISDEIRSGFQAGDNFPFDLFTGGEVWNGRPGQIEGLVRDWVSWQSSDDRDTFATFVQILEHLSPVAPEDLGPIEPGNPVRIPGDPRVIPTIRFGYGDVPIVLSSAGVQRILILAYMVIWAWREHTIAAEQAGRSPVRKMVIVVDEMEAHLHPRWQRVVLPALMTVGKLLSEGLKVQIIVATHSPLVLASVEADFSEESDVLYHLDLCGDNVVLEPLEFQKQGDSSAWLTSPVFGLRHARSTGAERAIEEAKKIQLNPRPDIADIRSVSAELHRFLASDDPFWPRWVFFAERAGIK